MRTLIAIPVYNEQRYLEPVIRRVLEEASRLDAHVLVIDDGSTDATPALLSQFPDLSVIRHPTNLGYGRGLRDAFAYAQAGLDDWVITMDCDEQHEPAALADFIAAARADTHDIISGSRYLTSLDGDTDAPADRRGINAELTREINDRLGSRYLEAGGEVITDAFCGFKAYRVEALRSLRLSEDGYAFPMQFWVQAAARNLRLREIAVRLIYNDPNRSFGGPLDDPHIRRDHYRRVLHCELERCADELPAAALEAVNADCS
ncbi:MAG: glycosyltransferase family 2 protein [Planctomycetota bacterium]